MDTSPLPPTVLVAGAAGFLGSNMVHFLLDKGFNVIGLDSYQSGSAANLNDVQEHPRFAMIRHFPLPELPAIHQIYHLACTASPVQYQKHPVDTINTAYLGTRNLLDLARQHSARILLSSTSEVYGEPQVHPQPETYWGNVNPFGPRSCYDEGKRAAEALAYSYVQEYSVDVRLARIFNAYGPLMHPGDGRVVSNFVTATISGQPIIITGDGTATRSFLYVDDCIQGLYTLMHSNHTGPINIGSDRETAIEDLANLVRALAHRLTSHQSPNIIKLPRPEDDPTRRQPEISLARRLLGWKPVVSLEEGLLKTIQWHIDLGRSGRIEGYSKVNGRL
ncbi:NAD-dependent nucleoside diphosphate-sugar epimerase/dehydratase [Aspergillus eucalypticola CBS 122712]|uniref:UDP-glucuronic acid decarboxylase 1 n=1 Tax=Aspergillus eucalypticola (strain CBS 122712 / IBT 29274) TaxID=1448314 RepID=A0A317UMH2_ASPEC|nr:NAD-dependent nucleoside diphosphate-sugar epimerase/dehydratase [Aspergillus eucalypticola CBS 122712]PWY61712.1 NAD-dependent nucleoside diphosphate-sugar epimerase/dehydratase [Aspergillus eucalypticola CBS 122712]